MGRPGEGVTPAAAAPPTGRGDEKSSGFAARLLPAALARVEAGEAGAEQGECGRLGRGRGRRSEDFELDAVVEEVAVGVEAEREVAAVRDVGEERVELRGGEVVDEVRGRRREGLGGQ